MPGLTECRKDVQESGEPIESSSLALPPPNVLGAELRRFRSVVVERALFEPFEDERIREDEKRNREERD